MSTTIDERVVSMQFDNKHFESNVQTTLSSLDKLKQSLNLSGATRGLEDVQAASNRLDMSGLGNAVESVRLRFSALEVMAVTALANITNSAVNAGKRMVSALTIDPIKAGFSEYETQINAIQTILANTQSKGTTLDDVNKALDTLNAYADKTIYNFTEMTRNIGTFTAAGIELDTATNAIQGIANLAAVSGSSSQQASTAMYQLSQALASGTVKLMDWNSVVNAGMGGQVFQDALKETARVHGVNIDAMIKEQGSFRETLQKGWLTSEILTETLQKFTMTTEGLTEAEIAKNREMLKGKGYTDAQIDAIFELGKTATDAATKVKTFSQLWDTLKEAAQSGWTQTWEIIVGDFKEAKELLTEISNVIGNMLNNSAKARNELLQGWKDAGGRTDLIDSFRNVFEGLGNIVKPISEAFREIFPPTTVKQLTGVTSGLKAMTESFKAFTEKHGPAIKATFKGIFSVLSVFVTIAKQIAGVVLKIASNFTGLADYILIATGAIGGWLTKVSSAIKETNAFGKAIDKIGGFIQNAINHIKQFGLTVKEAFQSKGFEGFLNVFGAIWNVVQKIGSKAGEVFASIGTSLSQAFRGGDITTALDIFNTGVIGAILLNIKKFVGGLADAFDDEGIFGNIKGALDSVRGSLEAYQQSLQANTLLKIAGAIGILAVSLVAIASINPERLDGALAGITALFVDLMGAMAVFDKLGGSYKGAAKAIGVMTGISISVLILAGALKMVSSIDSDKLFNGFIAVAGLTALVVAAAKVLATDSKAVVKGGFQMIMYAAALKILASVCKDLSVLSWEQLSKGLIGVGVLLGEIALFLNNTALNNKAISNAGGMLIMAFAIKVLAESVKVFAELSWEQIGKGLTAIGALLLEFAAFTMLTKGATGIISTAVALAIIAGAMKLLASAVQAFGSMSWEQIAKGLVAMAGALLAITVAVNFMPKNMIGVGVGLLAVSAALVIMSQALKEMGSMTWDEIGRGLTVLAGSLVLLSAALILMSGSLAGSAALLIAAAALNLLAPALQAMGSLSWEQIGKGLLVMAGAFVVLGAAGLLLGPLAPAIMAVSAAMALFGVACLAIGAGVAMFAAGLASLAVAGTAGATALVAALAVIVTGIIGLIPAIAEALGDAIVRICKVIGESAKSIGQAIKDVLLAVIDVLTECFPEVVDCVMLMITEILDALAEKMPELMDSGAEIILAILEGIAEHIEEITEAAIEVCIKFINGIASMIGKVVQAGFDLIIKFIDGLAEAIRKNTPKLMSAIKNLFDAIVEAALEILVSSVTGFVDIGGKLIKGLIKGIGSLLSSVGKAVKEIALEAIDTFTNFISDFTDIGSDIIDGVIKGITSGTKAIAKAAKKAAQSALDAAKDFLGINSPSKAFAEVGKFSDEGFAVGLKKYSNIVAKAAVGVGEKSMDSLRGVLSSFDDLNIDAQPTIRPVLDLSAVAAGAGAIDGMFGMTPSIGMLADVGSISSMMSGRQNGPGGDIISAIKDLKNSIGNASGDTYNINGVTYDDGSNISNAVKSLVRAAKVERRV